MNNFPVSVHTDSENIKFTNDQEVAVHGLIEFIAAPWSDKNYINALCGAGGVGKTFVTKYVIDNCKFSSSVIFCAAPTHKACRVLSNAIGGKKVNTIQSLFGFRLDVDIDNFDPNNPAFNPIGANKMLKDGYSIARLLIIDEASMLNIKLVNWINKFCLKHEIKVMYIGDASQLFPVKEKVSYAFKVATKTYYLREVVRQGANNPISKLLDLLREDINHTHSWKFLEYINLHKHEVNETGAGFTVCGKKDFINIVNNCFSDEEYTKNIDLYRIIAYTNVRVTAWNDYVRKIIIKGAEKSILNRHDLLMSYTTIVDDFNDTIINNSEEYVIKDIIDSVEPTYSMKGFLVRFQAIHGGKVSTPMFVIDHNDPYTCQIYYKQLTTLVNDAKSASGKSNRASKWKAYFEFKKKYLISTNILNPTTGAIMYTRDIDYGFAITSHRAQGSTYKTVFVDVNDMIYDKNGKPYTDRAELLRRLYVACSRASHELILMYGNLYMIRCIGFDVEILPNFFSITFVSINDYLKVFADVTDGKPIPLVQKLTVAEIKERLDKVEKWQFYITDKDDSQLFPMVDFINKTAPRREEDGSITRTDLYGFNNYSYDNLMIAALLSYYVQADSSKELITRLYETSKTIIKSQDDFEAFKNDFYLNSLKQFKLPYVGIDVMRIFALNKASVIIDKDTGERKSVPKGLKQTSINLQWYELLEYELPPITDKDAHFYSKMDNYRGMEADKLNRLIDKWDRYIIDEWIPDMMHYNLNDVYIVCEIVRLNPDEIKSRYAVSKTYQVDVLNSSRSKTADTLFEKFYSKFSGLAPEQWKGGKTERTAMSFKKVIFPFIEFKTPALKNLLSELYGITIYRTSKDAFSKEVTIGNVTYNLATGGLHSQDRPMELWSTTSFGDYSSPTGGRKYTIYHYDVASYYPSIMADHSVYPEHLNKGAFVGLIKWMRDTRVTVKHSNEKVIDGIPKDVLALVLKIVINSIYGKFGFEKGSLYDRLAVLRVTVNGQLMLLMLCEALELEGISIISANTDGIMVKVYEDQEDKFNEISDWWREKTKMKADSDIVHCLIARDVNNYIAQFRTIKNGVPKLKLEYKGALNPFMYAIDLQKGYDMPIVAQAVSDYFLKGVPIMDTLQSATNILDFCKTQNVGRQFHVEETKVVNGKVKHIVCQRYVRFYVSNNGVVIEKVHNDTGQRSRLAAGSVVTVLNTLDDKDIALRDINFRYYYQECIKIIDPIKLGITPKGSGKTKIKKQSGLYNSLFDEEDFN